MDHTDIGNAFLGLEIIGQDTLCEGFAVFLPLDCLSVGIYLELDNRYFPFFGSIAHYPPGSCLFVFCTLCVVDLAVGEVIADRFIADLIFDREVILRHDTDFDAVHLRRDDIKTDRVSASGRKYFSRTNAMP